MLERIGPAVSEDALTLLRWLAYGMRPVTLAELQTAVTIRPEDDEVDYEDEGDFRDSLDILAGLVVFSDGADSTEDVGYTQYDKASVETQELTPRSRVRLAHFSVKEYLESERISGTSASFFRLEAGACHKFLAQSCLTYLKSYSRSGEKVSPKLDVKNFHLLNYAASKWHEHSRLQSGDGVSREVSLLECEDARLDWLRIKELQRDGTYLCAQNSRCTPSIFYAVFLRLSRVVKELLEAGQDANAIGLYSEPLLVTATDHGDQATMELLLAHGADIDMAPTARGGANALYLAASRGLLLTKLLVDNGADVNFECLRGTPLSAACGKNDHSVVKFLLERGARVNNVEWRACTALTTASRCGHPEMVKFLIAKGADVNHPSSPSTPTTPLIEAAGSGHTDVMVILVDAGADVNAQGSSALVEALMGAHEHAVTFLEAKGTKKPTLEQLNDALIAVCEKREVGIYSTYGDYEKAISLLLDRGADVNANGGRALSAVLKHGDQYTVAMLEARGAKLTLEQLNHAFIEMCDARSLSVDPETALNWFLDRGADINAKDSGALLAALEHGDEDLVAMLEAKGANKPSLKQLKDALVEVRGDQYRWELGHETAIQMLLDRGADGDAADSESSLIA